MAIVYELVAPCVEDDGGTTEWSAVGDTDHYKTVDEGVVSPDDADYIQIQQADKTEEFVMVKTLTNSSGYINKVRVGFRYAGEALPMSPALAIELWVDSAQWGSTNEFNIDTGGVDEIVDGQAEFNVSGNYEVTEWTGATEIILKFISRPEGAGFPPPPEFDFESHYSG